MLDRHEVEGMIPFSAFKAVMADFSAATAIVFM
jgi:hypothetical protein